jgi:hypothetical protein
MNNLLIILLILLFIMVLLKLFTVTEGFENQFSKEFIDKYNNFVKFYNEFQANWSKALITGIGQDTPQQPLTDPSQVSSASTPQPSISEINSYSFKLSTNLQQPFPQITDSLPKQINSIESIRKIIPNDFRPYQNALNYMNKQLEDSISNMDRALKGEEVEGFEDMCKDISECIANNPDLVNKIAQAQQNQNKLNQAELESELIERMNKFTQNNSLMQSFKKNQSLFAKADEIKRQAESGELINQMDLPKEPEIVYEKSAGDDTLTKMKKDNPDKYKRLEKDGKQFFALKQLIEQINSAL